MHTYCYSFIVMICKNIYLRNVQEKIKNIIVLKILKHVITVH